MQERTCSKCNAFVEEGTKFCPECGEKIVIPIEVVAPIEVMTPVFTPTFCPECGTQTSTEFAFCPECGAKLGKMENETAPIVIKVDEPKQKIKLPKKPPVKIIVAAALAAIVILAVVLIIENFNFTSKPHLLYAKDNEINFTYLSKIKPFELTSDLIDSQESWDSYTFSIMNSYVLTSENGRYIFYPDRCSDGFSSSYYWRDLKAENSDEDSTVKIDSEMTFNSAPVISKDGSKFFYTKGDDNRLYVYDRKSEEKEKIDTDVDSFYVNDGGDYLIYTKYTDGESTIYEMSLNGLTGEKNKIDNNSEIQRAYPNSKKIFYLKEGSLYCKSYDKEKVKISSDVSEVVSVVNEESVYYLKSEEVTNNLSDFINDDMLTDDSALTEPAYPTYPVEPTCPLESDYTTSTWNSSYWGSTWNSELQKWGYWKDDTDWDAYNLAYSQYETEYTAWQANCDVLNQEYSDLYDVYQGKLYRDELRTALSSEDNAVTYSKYTLCYWNNELESIIASDVAQNDYNYSYYLASSSEVPIVVYQKYSTANVDNQKLSDLLIDYGNNFYYEDVVYDITNKITASRAISEDICVASKEKENILDSTDATNWDINDKGELYYIDSYNSEDGYGTLMSAAITDGKIAKPETIDEDVAGYRFGNGNENVYYYKNVKDGTGDIYLSGNSIATDVLISSLYNYKDSDTLLYYIDYSYTNYDGTLCELKDNKQTKIADDVNSFVAVDEKNIAYLSDFSQDNQKGDLKLYNGKKKSETIDTDITALIWANDMVW